MSERKKSVLFKIIILTVVLLIVMLTVSRCRNDRPETEGTAAVQTEPEITQAAEETTAPPVIRKTEVMTQAVRPDLPDKENLVGRLIIDDLGLDEYLMQGDEYLELDNDGNYALQGSIYLPGYSTDECIFINGHTMKDGSMFGNLYKQRDHLPGMKVILQNEEEETEFRIVRTYIVSGTDEKAVAALFTGGYKDYLKETWDLEVTGTVLSLMCCEYSLKDGRLFVVAEEQ